MHSTEKFRPLATSSRMGQKIQGALATLTGARMRTKVLILAALLCNPSLHLEAQNAVASFATNYDQHWVFETSNGHIWHIVYTYSDGSFGYGDLTQAASAPPAAAGSGLSSFSTDYDQHWVFQTSDGHIGQIVYTYGSGSFGYGDLTQAANAPPAAIGSGLSSFATANDQHWVFETSDGHVRQIVFTYSSSGFSNDDLTQRANAPSAVIATGLTSFATDKDQHWVFQTSDGHIWQIVFTDSNGSFGYDDLTQRTGAPPAAIGALSSFATDKDQHWAFETDDGNIWQIVYTYNKFCFPLIGCFSFPYFGYGNLTTAANAPPAAVGTGLSSFATANDQHWAFQQGGGQISQIVYTYSNSSLGYGNLTGAANAPLATFAESLPTWSYSWKAAKDSATYSGSLVGNDFFTSNAPTVVPTVIIPVVLNISQNGSTYTFDPTAPDAGCLGDGNTALTLLTASPLFSQTDLNINGADVGVTQYGDAQLRAEAWNYVQANGGGYHVLLSPIIGPKLTISVNGGVNGSVDNTTGLCGTNTGSVNLPGYLGVVDIDTIDSQMQKFINEEVLTPGELPLFLLYNSVISPSYGSGFYLGYHAALPNGQTYAVTGFEGRNQSLFEGVADVSVASHEIGEWLNDPWGSNATPAWGDVGQVFGACQNNLEVGDPLSETLLPPVTMPNGFTYHLQELAFFSWFYGGPSFGAGGSYSTNGAFTTPAPVCNSTGSTRTTVQRSIPK